MVIDINKTIRDTQRAGYYRGDVVDNMLNNPPGFLTLEELEALNIVRKTPSNRKGFEEIANKAIDREIKRLQAELASRIDVYKEKAYETMSMLEKFKASDAYKVIDKIEDNPTDTYVEVIGKRLGGCYPKFTNLDALFVNMSSNLYRATMWIEAHWKDTNHTLATIKRNIEVVQALDNTQATDFLTEYKNRLAKVIDREDESVCLPKETEDTFEPVTYPSKEDVTKAIRIIKEVKVKLDDETSSFNSFIKIVEALEYIAELLDTLVSVGNDEFIYQILDTVDFKTYYDWYVSLDTELKDFKQLIKILKPETIIKG
jgi:prefoldin subunit 5